MIATAEITANQFREQGFARLDEIIDADELAALRDLYDRCFTAASSSSQVNLGGTVDGKRVLPQILNPHEQFPELLKYRFAKRLHALAKCLLGSEAEFRNDHMINKPAEYGAETPWHQDQAYHDPKYRYCNVNFWMPMNDATPENGCLHFVPGSHRGTVLPHHHINTPGGTALAAIDQAYWQANSVCVPCPAGSATAHHSYMLHYAAANQTKVSRQAYVMVFVLPKQPLPTPLRFPWRASG